MKPTFRIALTTAALAYLFLGMANLHLTMRLKQDAEAREKEATVIVFNAEPLLPVHIENIARRFLEGRDVPEHDLTLLSEFIEDHQPKWDAWAATQDAPF